MGHELLCNISETERNDRTCQILQHKLIPSHGNSSMKIKFRVMYCFSSFYFEWCLVKHRENFTFTLR
jgi:hypothetical protein